MTAGVAAPAYAGIPVTHRDLASAVAFVTGHEDPSKEESALDWDALAAFPGTLVLYMGVKNLPRIAERLIAAGRPADEPAAVVERGTLPGQRDGERAAPRASPTPVDGRGPARARDHGDRAGRRSCARRSRGSRSARCTARWWRSPARGRRRAGWRRGWRRWGPRWSRRPSIRIEPLAVDLPGDRLLRARLLHQPQRRGPVLRRPRGGRARARRRDGRRDRPRHRARAGRARDQRGRGAAAIGGGVAGGGAGDDRGGGQAGADRARGRGARRAARRAARARRRRGGAAALRDRGGAARSRTSSAPWSAPRTSRSPRPPPCASSWTP